MIADIPGLIAGAAQGKGLGHQFLRHVERNLVIMHLIDCQQQDLFASYQKIMDELKAYNPQLLQRPHLLILTKIDTLPMRVLRVRRQALKRKIPANIKIYAVSSLANLNLDRLLKDLKKTIRQERRRLQAAKPPQQKKNSMAIFKLDKKEAGFSIERKDDSCFLVCGAKIEIFALKTDFADFHSKQRLLDIMDKMGIVKRLIANDYKNELIVFGREEIGGLHLSEDEDASY